MEENKETVSSSPMLVKTYGDIYFNTQDTEQAVRFFEELGIFPLLRYCKKCGSSMRKTNDKSRKDKKKWVCTSMTACGHVNTLRSGTWLEKAKLSFEQIAKIMFCWSHKLPQQFAVNESGASARTMVDWYNFCRDICEVVLMNQEYKKIGGEGKIVEIDESKFGKRKYNKGKKVEGQWVFGGVERDSDKIFLASVPNRTKETLMGVLEEYVDGIKDLYNTYFFEYMWRRQFARDNNDAFNKLAEHIVLYAKDLEEMTPTQG
ncbi:19763_t:CDS:2 [Gigaspora margarita]|uniref:19763_t:CDS:1 n=1 Tax=Gigaspora margarita TaxID=4874 RepID=A0ABN7VZ48_GIGMA|nr:19763_t:CDS:2 [Gigaspora margarita]